MADAHLKTTSRTVTDTIYGEHTHTIVGYSLIKGIGDGEPIASERFTVGGHEWVLLFYPDGKRSSSETQAAPAQHAMPPNLPQPVPAAQGRAGAPDPMMMLPGRQVAGAGDQQAPGGGAMAGGQMQQFPPHHHLMVPGVPPQVVPPAIHRHVRRDAARRVFGEENEYAALFVALIGEGASPQGVVSTSDGKVVRAFHRFTLVDQTGQGRDITKGRLREAGAVKISCARQDPNARNCHGYRKFVRRSTLEDPSKGYLVDDTVVIKYSIELVVTQGGALTRCVTTNHVKSELIKVPPPVLGRDLATLLDSGKGADVKITVEDETFEAHRFILEARSPVFHALLNIPMREGSEGVADIKDIQPPVFKALLFFMYTDSLPDELEDGQMDAAIAQHLLEAADRYQLVRLRRICERRLCQTVDVDTVATTLTLAEQNHAEELKRVCLDFVARNLSAVIATDGYQHMLASCPSLQADIIKTVATIPVPQERHSHRHPHLRLHLREHGEGEDGRRVRPRRAE
ncbi:unnamed protein product [Ostreobium quekettii]|uniref:Uncharacterized protein n=1 Tax=Ostreobium quekettii TaxID=121088 RepID=A0A8S1ISJ9_9CHLO|nr:unnamed protein product [Ostreobium quekettii]